MDYGNNYTPQQISDVYAQLLNSGTSVQDIVSGAKNNLGIGADQLIGALHSTDPTINGGTDAYIHSLYGDGPGTEAGKIPIQYQPRAGMGGSGVNLNAYSQNPYLTQMGQGLQKQFNDNLTMNTLPALRGGAVQVGGVGGSRQGIAEGMAGAQSNAAADNAITGLYGQDYGQQMDRNLRQYQSDQQFNLGLGALDNQKYATDTGFYTQQRQLDQSGAQLGANLYNLGTQGQWAPLNNANGVYGSYTGFGPSSATSSQGGGTQGIIGGALAGAQLGKNFGWWG